MYYLLDKKHDETLTINFIGTEQFSPKDKLTLIVPDPLTSIVDITSYTDTVVGETNSVYLQKYYQYKIGVDSTWSNPIEIENITLQAEFKNISINKEIYLKLLYFRVDDGGDNNSVTITLSNPIVGGKFEYSVSDEQLVLTPSNNTQIFEIPDVFKIFKLTSFQVISSAKYNELYTVNYRFSQDNKNTWSKWEPLTNNNISTAKIDRLRFVNIQYLFELREDNLTPVKIYDVILYGDIQNISADYIKINRFGLKENCVNLYNKSAGITEQTSGINDKLTTANGGDSTTQSLVTISSQYQLHMNFLTQGLSCFSDGGSSKVLKNLEAQNSNTKNTLWNPYEFKKPTEFYNFLANTVSDVLGFTIDYHRTDPDAGGIDKVMFEYQLHNIVDMKQVKVIVPDNQFPDNQVQINVFNLDMFDTFKINIMKDAFKQAFGEQFRPGKEDILYFCQTNRMYIVKHAQVHKDFMNGGVYYDVILEKYEKRSNVVNKNEDSKLRIEELTRNTTIDALFGFDIDSQQKQISNKQQLIPKTIDLNRESVDSKLVYSLNPLYNGERRVMESYYDLSSVVSGQTAVTYSGTDELISSDNRAFTVWFKFPNLYDANESVRQNVIDSYSVKPNIMYNLLDNSVSDKLGYRIWYQNSKIWFMINGVFYTLPVTVTTNIWYSLVINLDQRQSNVSIKMFKRDTEVETLLIHPKTYEMITLNMITDKSDIDYEISVNGFKPVDNMEIEPTRLDSLFTLLYSNNTPIKESFEFKHDGKLNIRASNIYLSNVRVLNDIVSDGQEQQHLSELIMRDAQYIILADNAEKTIKTTNYITKNWR